MVGRVLRDDIAERSPRQRCDQTYSERAISADPGRMGSVDCGRQIIENRTGVRSEGHTRLGQTSACGTPFEQRYPEHILQLMDASSDRGLSHMKALTRSPKTASFGDGKQNLKVAKF